MTHIITWAILVGIVFVGVAIYIFTTPNEAEFRLVGKERIRNTILMIIASLVILNVYPNVNAFQSILYYSAMTFGYVSSILSLIYIYSLIFHYVFTKERKAKREPQV